MERREVDGLGVRVHRGGSGEPLLYLHSGFGEAGRTHFVGRLEDHFSVLAPELPGFGGSDAPTWHGVEDAVYFLRCLLDDEGWDRGTVVGSSLGGWLAAELAVWFPERVASLVLIDPVGIEVEGAPVADVFMPGRTETAELLFHELPADLGAALGDALSGSDGDLLLHLYKAMEATARIGWNPYLHDPLLPGRLARCRAPTTVVWGEGDGVTSRAYAQAYADAFPWGRLVTLPDVGHLPVVEAPDQAADALLASLDEAVPTAP